MNRNDNASPTTTSTSRVETVKIRFITDDDEPRSFEISFREKPVRADKTLRLQYLDEFDQPQCVNIAVGNAL